MNVTDITALGILFFIVAALVKILTKVVFAKFEQRDEICVKHYTKLEDLHTDVKLLLQKTLWLEEHTKRIKKPRDDETREVPTEEVKKE